MALEVVKNINIDFYDKKYVLINAKQYDDKSRWIAITCYNQGNLFNLNASKHSAYVKYRKADGHGVLNYCRINYKGEVLVELTEQMLAADGICNVDLVIVNKGSAIVNVDTGEIITVDDSPILSTMAFCVNVYETTIENPEIESSYEYDALNNLLQRTEANYAEVIQLSKSYAIGDANNVRENENFDNSKYYSLLSKSYAIGDLDGSTKTKDRENEHVDNAEYYSRLAKSYAKGDLSGNTGTRNEEGTDNAQYYSQMSKSFAMGGTGLEVRGEEDIDNAEYYSRLSMSYAKGGTNIDERNSNGKDENLDNAEYYSRLAKSYTMGSFDGDTGTRSDESTKNAKTYMETAKSYMDNAETYMNNAKTSETNSKTSETNAATSESNTYDYFVTVQRYAVGGTDTVSGEDTDNVKYYYQQVKGIQDSLSGTLSPKGTISFEELATVEKFTGYMYIVDESFITDETFAVGEDIEYPAGTLVYYTVDGLWATFEGVRADVATVEEVKVYLGI